MRIHTVKTPCFRSFCFFASCLSRKLRRCPPEQNSNNRPTCGQRTRVRGRHENDPGHVSLTPDSCTVTTWVFAASSSKPVRVLCPVVEVHKTDSGSNAKHVLVLTPNTARPTLNDPDASIPPSSQSGIPESLEPFVLCVTPGDYNNSKLAEMKVWRCPEICQRQSISSPLAGNWLCAHQETFLGCALAKACIR